MRHHGFLAVVLAGTTIATGWILSHSVVVDASEEQSSSYREAYAQSGEHIKAAEDPTGLRLNYYDARWNRVLQDLAEYAELVLVMDKVPPGRFARRDRTRYATDDCIRILNRELEGLGFRLIKQSRFLIVLHLDQVRTRYARPVLTPRDSTVSTTSAEPHKTIQTASARIDRTDEEVVSEAHTTAENDERRSQHRHGFTTIIPIRTTGLEKSAEVENQEGSSTSLDVMGANPVIRQVEIEHGNAAELARAVYLVFKRRAELVHKGIQGQPTFIVYDTNDEQKSGTPLFRIAIDQKNNSLIVQADDTRADQLITLMEHLDKPPADKREKAANLVASEEITKETAKELNDQLRRLVDLQIRENNAGNATDGPVVGTTPDISDSETFNLRGDVNIQAMQGTGVLLIEGNEEDLERLTPIIRRLEELSKGTLPDIHLLELKHVNSEAFAELLTAVYDRLTELRQGGAGGTSRESVAFFPVVQPNSVLILAPQLELSGILELAKKLDTKLVPDSEFQVFELKHAIASQVVTALTTFYESRPGLATRVRAVADVRTNSVIVQGHPRDLTEVQHLVDGLDSDEPGAVHQIKVIELKHATAEELAEVLNAAIQAVTSPPRTTDGATGFGGNQGPQELRDSKSVALEFLATDGDAQRLIRSGFLVDVRINADPRSNTLIISAPEASMSLLQALTGTLDQAPSATAAIKVFALKNADAEQSVLLLTTMFENTNQQEQLGVQIAGAEDAASSLIPLQFSADIRTNTVLAVGSEEALSIVEAILLRLDTDDTRKRTTTVIQLRNAFAPLAADSINLFLEQQQALRDSTDDLISNIERIRQEVIVAADENSNSLIVSASPDYFSEITQLITELDATPPQVIVQALIVEVELDNTDEFGVELGFQDPLLFRRSIVENGADLITIPTSTLVPGVGTVESTTIVTQSSAPGFNFNNTAGPLGNNFAAPNPGTVAGQGISGFSLGRQNGDLGFGGFVFSAQSDAVNVLIRALAARRTLHVLSRPQIRTVHNIQATIRVGQEIPVVNGVDITEGGIVNPVIEQRNTGIILEVTPRITPDGTVVMAVYAEKSALTAGGVPVFTDINTGNSIESPIRDISIAETTVNVPNGQTVVIGGIITKADKTLERKVPWLGDLPVVGKAFRYDATSTARTELLIFLTPRIIHGDADSELIKQVETERLHFLESEAEEIHGPLYSIPASAPPLLKGPGPNLGHTAPADQQFFPYDKDRHGPRDDSQSSSHNSAGDSKEDERQVITPTRGDWDRRTSRVREADFQGRHDTKYNSGTLRSDKRKNSKQPRSNQSRRLRSAAQSELPVLEFDFEGPEWKPDNGSAKSRRD
ncbi:MAG: hypothetical protein MK102_17425 [Fuerstiella sp.]|nr:hypothetical protein [Fuerstiella sp.]